MRKKRDPLRLALITVGDFERWLTEYDLRLMDGEYLFQRAQLRLMYALVAEVRALRAEKTGGNDETSDA